MRGFPEYPLQRGYWWPRWLHPRKSPHMPIWEFAEGTIEGEHSPETVLRLISHTWHTLNGAVVVRFVVSANGQAQEELARFLLPAGLAMIDPALAVELMQRWADWRGNGRRDGAN